MGIRRPEKKRRLSFLQSKLLFIGKKVSSLNMPVKQLVMGYLPGGSGSLPEEYRVSLWYGSLLPFPCSNLELIPELLNMYDLISLNHLNETLYGLEKPLFLCP